MTAVVPAGSGLHVLYVDGRNASDAGDYVVRGARP
jgi:hypothetical protein